MRLACVTPGLCLLAALCVLLPGCSGAGHSACNSSTDCAGGGMCVDQSCVSSPADAGASDAGQPGDGGLDGATSDGGVDAGSPDAGGLDAGDSDAGSWDAGESDAGVIDAGNSDAGASDAGGGVVPAAPTSVLATAEDDEALVVWTAPAANGGPAITGYVVTGSPGGSATTTGSTRVAVVGLTAGTPYTFTVAARNSAGEGPASAPSSAVTPWECNPVTDTEGDSANCPTGQVCGLNELCANAAYTPSSGTVADAVTGLIWQQTVTGTLYTWDSTGQSTSSAQYYCAHLSLGGFSSGWRLPTLAELFSIVVVGTTQAPNVPTIDQTTFPGTPQDLFWSSTVGSPTTYAWTVFFGPSGSYLTAGSSEPSIASHSAATVRCVR